MPANRYFRIPRKEINALARIRTSYMNWEESEETRLSLAGALGIRESDEYAVSRMKTAKDVISFAVNDCKVGFAIEDTRSNINSDAGTGWCALTVGDNRGPGRDLGLHADELSSAQLEFVRALMLREGIGVELPEYAVAEEASTI